MNAKTIYKIHAFGYIYAKISTKEYRKILQLSKKLAYTMIETKVILDNNTTVILIDIRLLK